MTIQEQVAEAVAARGYREGWTAEQFAARQVAKLAEELGELQCVFFLSGKRNWGGDSLEHAIDDVGAFASERFNDRHDWNDARPVPGALATARAELADIQVVVFALASALSEIDGEPFDVMQAALDKATADVERGRR